MLHKHKWTSPFHTDRETTRDAFAHRARRGSPKRDLLRSDGRSARRQRRAKGKLPMPRQFRRRGRGQFAANSDGPLDFRESGCGSKQQHADRREDQRLRLLGEKGGGRQSPAGLVAIARAGSALRMFLRAAILFAQPARRINQTARSRWQPNERQHQRDRCFDTLHVESNTTEAGPGQCGRLGLNSACMGVLESTRLPVCQTQSALRRRRKIFLRISEEHFAAILAAKKVGRSLKI